MKKLLLILCVIVGLCCNIAYCKEFAECDDFYHYKESDLVDKQAKSAEFNVLSKCWGCGTVVDTTPFQNQKLSSYYNMNKVLDYKFIINETLNVPEYNFTHTFTMHHYYAQDVPFEHYLETGHTTREVDDVLSILTDYNINKYFKPYVQEHMGNLYPDEYSYNKETGKRTLVNDRSDDRSAGVDEILGKVIEFRNIWYARIGVITEGYNEKSFFVLGPGDFNFENLVFAEVPGGEIGILMAIEVDSENGHNIYCQHRYEPIANATDIIMAQDEESAQENKKQYRLSDTCYYLCADCATCDEDGCDGLVASGIDYNTDNAIGQYFSKYCPKHACRFVWEWEADPNNNGETIEGLRCIDRKLDGFEYCADHKCRSCSNPIVGVSLTCETKDVPDARATGNASRAQYSNYCADHKCRFPGCQNARYGGQVTSPDTSNPMRITSPNYCLIHCAVCCYCGKNPVSAKAYEAAGVMICEECLSLSKEEIRTLKVYRYLDALLGEYHTDPDARVIFFFGGSRMRNSAEDTMGYFGDLINSEKFNLISVAIPEDLDGGYNAASDWNAPIDSIVSWVIEKSATGEIDPRDTIYLDGYANGGYAAFKLANQLQGMTVEDENGNQVTLNVKCTLLNGTTPATCTYDAIDEFLANGGSLNVYASATTEPSNEAANERSRLILRKYGDAIGGGVVDYTGNGTLVSTVYQQGLHLDALSETDNGEVSDGYSYDSGTTLVPYPVEDDYNKMQGTMIYSDMDAQDIVGSGSKDGAAWYHTYKNTGIPITFDNDGKEYTGYIFSNFDAGVEASYANDYKTFFSEGDTTYFVRLYVDEDGTWKTGNVERYGRETFDAALEADSASYANDYKTFFSEGDTIYFMTLHVDEDGTWKTGNVERYGQETFVAEDITE